MVLPTEILHRAVGKRIEVRLKDQRLWSGILTGYDDRMNLVIEETQEHVDGGEPTSLGRVVLRGSHVLSIGMPEQ